MPQIFHMQICIIYIYIFASIIATIMFCNNLSLNIEKLKSAVNIRLFVEVKWGAALKRRSRWDVECVAHSSTSDEVTSARVCERSCVWELSRTDYFKTNYSPASCYSKLQADIWMILILDNIPDHTSTSSSTLIHLLTVGFGKDIFYFSRGMKMEGKRDQTSMSTCVVTFIPKRYSSTTPGQTRVYKYIQFLNRNIQKVL